MLRCILPERKSSLLVASSKWNSEGMWGLWNSKLNWVSHRMLESDHTGHQRLYHEPVAAVACRGDRGYLLQFSVKVTFYEIMSLC